MSKFGLTIGLVLSVLLHLWLLHGDTSVSSVKASGEPVKIETVDILEVEKIPKPEKKIEKQDKKTKPEVSRPVNNVVKEQTKPLFKPVPPKKTKPLPIAMTKKPSRSTVKTKGDFTGSQEGVDQPVMRINWGTPYDAERFLEIGKMKLIILGPDDTFKDEVKRSNSGNWQRAPIHYNSTIVFSNAIRVVDQVPAFEQIKKQLSLKAGEKLAVLVPITIEKIIETTKLTAVSKRDLTMNDVKTLGGHFFVLEDKIFFEIDRIQERSNSW
jgi:hypothetical protein